MSQAPSEPNCPDPSSHTSHANEEAAEKIVRTSIAYVSALILVIVYLAVEPARIITMVLLSDTGPKEALTSLDPGWLSTVQNMALLAVGVLLRKHDETQSAQAAHQPPQPIVVKVEASVPGQQ